jgi:hypothetical protein
VNRTPRSPLSREKLGLPSREDSPSMFSSRLFGVPWWTELRLSLQGEGGRGRGGRWEGGRGLEGRVWSGRKKRSCAICGNRGRVTRTKHRGDAAGEKISIARGVYSGSRTTS